MLRTSCFSATCILIMTFSASCFAQFSTHYTKNGLSINSSFGASVSTAGDVNGDGFTDFIVGAPLNDFNGINDGAMFVYSGLTGALIYSRAGLSGDQYGLSVSDAGDVNADGFDDFIVGAPFDDTNGPAAGAAYLYSGATGNLLYAIGGLTGDNFGTSVSGAGDVNADGFDDFIIGSPRNGAGGTDSGSIYVYSGINGAFLFTKFGFAGDQLGRAVSAAGDVDADGYDDVIVGSPFNDFGGTDAGAAYIFSGLTSSILFSKAGTLGSNFGWSVDGTGDVNRDGFDDVIVGSPVTGTAGPNSGASFVYSGIDASQLYSNIGNSGDLFGWSVAGAGDVNGDGFADFIVGAPLNDGAANNGGAIAIYSGIDGALLSTAAGAGAGNNLGYSVDGAGIINFDQFNDVIVGSPGVSTGAVPGTAQVFTAPALPTLNYNSDIGPTTLTLDWLPDASDPFSLTGTLTCAGATPGGIGQFGVSLGPANTLIFGFPLLIGIDPVNLIDMGSLGYSFTGDAVIPNVTRQYPSLAGAFVFIQFYEVSPLIKGSNGIALLLSS
ncbi:MAG: hypothetical protein ACI97A_002915 [Planctomycetota bacterium]|jgi:hypothetical protein